MLKKYALWTSLVGSGEHLSDGDRAYFVLYDIEEAYSKLRNREKLNGKLDGQEFLELVFGETYPDIASGPTCVKSTFTVASHELDCNKAWEVLFAAAINGLGPSMYDMIMSISPNGIVSDRESVSDKAGSVYSYYANRREDVSKTFLDSTLNHYTETTIDDCKLHKYGDELNSATIKWTIEYLTSNYPELYEKYLEEMDPESGDTVAEDYLNEFLEWLETSPYLPNDTTYIYEEWQNMFLTDQKYLIDFHQGSFENESYLDMSYNTEYAKSAFESLVQNHGEFLHSIRKDFIWNGIDEAIDEIDEVYFPEITGTFFDGIDDLRWSTKHDTKDEE